MEEYRDVAGYEGIYQVSNFGKVKRLPTTIIMRNAVCEWEQPVGEYLFVPSLDSHGYPQITLSINNKRICRIHRLVAEAFLAPPSEELISECKAAGIDYVPVNHKDSNRSNNHVNNLEWCSPAHNITWMQQVTKTSNYNKTAGENNYCNILKEKDVDEILKLLRAGGISQQEIANIFGVKQITISNIWTGRSWAWYTGISRCQRSTKKRSTKSISEATLF